METGGELHLDREVAQTLQRIEQHLAAMREAQRTSTREWLTVQDVADELRVSRDTIERLVASGQLKAAELRTLAGLGRRRRYRIRREWVEEFLVGSIPPQPPETGPSERRRNHRPQHDFIG